MQHFILLMAFLFVWIYIFKMPAKFAKEREDADAKRKLASMGTVSPMVDQPSSNAQPSKTETGSFGIVALGFFSILFAILSLTIPDGGGPPHLMGLVVSGLIAVVALVRFNARQRING